MAVSREKVDGPALRKEGRRWLERIEAAATREKDWIDDAEIAVATYAGGKAGAALTEPGNRSFNILFSNVETIVPAVINSPPAPDIRRRFGDADEVAKDLSELLERSITVQVDDSRLQIEMEACAQDGFLAGRGIVRLRFKADVGDGYDEVFKLAEKTTDDDGRNDRAEPEGEGSVSGDGADYPSGNAPAGTASETLSGERICFEAVSWRDARHGPAKRWEDVPWWAFRHAMAMEDRDAFADTALTDAQSAPEDKIDKGETENDVIIWEIWNKRTKKVWFVEEDTGKVLKRVDDPLGLTKFFPIADPVQPIEVTGRLMPVNAYAIYRKLADELDLTTRRISIITRQMAVKGWYPGSAGDIAAMLAADDTDFVPIADAEIWAQNGGLQGAVAFWPIEKFIVALRELYTAREQTKQAIYEITGISDIVRGASVASETATAQQIKTQWGSLRIQKFQRMMERCARDLFVMMSEIIPSKFSAETLQQMTGVQLIPTEQDSQPTPLPNVHNMDEEMAAQAQQEWQQAEQARMAKLQHLAALNALLRQKLQSFYRIDVESDSTVRADLTRQKQEVAEFLQGAASYFAAVGPLVQQGALPMDVAVEIFASNARMFNLGKSTEDALDRLLTMAKEQSQQPTAPQPNPEVMKAEAEIEAKKADEARKQQQWQAEGEAFKAEQQRKAVEADAKARAGQKALDDAAKLAEVTYSTAVLNNRITEKDLEIREVDLKLKNKALNAPAKEAA